LQAKIFHYGSIGLIDEQCKVSYLAALRFAKTCNCILLYDPKLRLPLWPSAEAARNGIMSIWNLADVIKISEDEITLLIDDGDPYDDDDDVKKKLFHPTLKLLIVTSGSKGCRYYTNVSLPKSFNSDFNCLNRFYNLSFHYFLCSLLWWVD